MLLPLSRIPPLYEFRIRSRIFRLDYSRLREIEDALAASSAQPVAAARQLSRLESRVEAIQVPLSHADELYALRSH